MLGLELCKSVGEVRSEDVAHAETVSADLVSVCRADSLLSSLTRLVRNSAESVTSSALLQEDHAVADGSTS